MKDKIDNVYFLNAQNDENKKVRYKLMGNTFNLRAACFFCDNDFRRGSAAVYVFYNGDSIGSICPECIQTGGGDVMSRLQNKIAHTQRYLEFLEDLLSCDFSGLPTFQEYKAIEEKTERNLKNGIYPGGKLYD